MPEHYKSQRALFEPVRCAIARFLLWATGELHRQVTMRLLPKNHPSRVFFERQLNVRDKLIEFTIPSANERRRRTPDDALHSYIVTAWAIAAGAAILASPLI